MKNLLIFGFVFIFIFSCSDNTTVSNNSTKEILPLKVGNSWIYTRQNFHSSKRDSVTYIDTMKYIVSGSISLNDENWYFLEYNSEKDDYIYANRSDGLWCIYAKDSNNINRSAAKLFLKYPTKVNDINSIDDSVSYSTIKVDYKIVTAAGQFSCIKYSKSELAGVLNCGLYYSAGVGKVMSEEIIEIQFKDRIWDTTFLQNTLVKYNLK